MEDRYGFGARATAIIIVIFVEVTMAERVYEDRDTCLQVEQAT